MIGWKFWHGDKMAARAGQYSFTRTAQ